MTGTNKIKQVKDKFNHISKGEDVKDDERDVCPGTTETGNCKPAQGISFFV